MAWNPTPEQKRLIEEGRRAFAEPEEPLPQEAADRLLAKMQNQADANAALARPGPARDVHREIDAMDRNAFEAEFADVLNANAYDRDRG